MLSNLSDEQIYGLAKPLVGKVEVISDFFKNPENEKEYQKWYFDKYGQYPHE
jgi:hypothetical protein